MIDAVNMAKSSITFLKEHPVAKPVVDSKNETIVKPGQIKSVGNQQNKLDFPA